MLRRIHIVCVLMMVVIATPAFAQYTTTRVSVSSAGAQATNNSSVPSVSPDGRYVAFASQATNLVSGDTNLSLIHI